MHITLRTNKAGITAQTNAPYFATKHLPTCKIIFAGKQSAHFCIAQKNVNLLNANEL